MSDEQITEKDYYTIQFDDYIVPFRSSGVAKEDPKFFRKVYINPRTLINIMNHSLTTKKEIMGFLAGHFNENGRVYLITDAIALPIEGTETRVTATDDAIWSYIEHFDNMKLLGRTEDSTGWYHSHPGLTCFFSGIDVQNHRLHAQGRGGCFVGLVIDPIATASSGILNLGAYSTIPIEMVKETELTPEIIEKYGTFADHYYELDIHFFKTQSDDIILNDIITRSYSQSIQASPLDMNAEYIGKNTRLIAEEVKRINTQNEREEDVLHLRKKIQSINHDRKTGLWIQKMKKSVFG